MSIELIQHHRKEWENTLTLSIVIADNNHRFIERFCAVIQEHEIFNVVAQIVNRNDIVHAIEELKPTLLFLDIAMLDDGLETIQKIHACVPTTKIIILSLYTKPIFVKRALENGACGFLSKNNICKEFNLAIDTILKGGQFLSNDLRLNK